MLDTYLHNDIFRYVTREISHDITQCYLMAVLGKLITRVVIATGPVKEDSQPKGKETRRNT